MCAQALLAAAAARPDPSAAEPPAASGARQPAAWRDTGKLPATASDRPPGDDPGLVKVSVPEARRLVRLATEPMSRPPATSVMPGHDGGAATRPAPDGTTTTPGSKPPTSHEPGRQKRRLSCNKPGL